MPETGAERREEHRYAVRSVERAFEILEALRLQGAMRLTEITRRLSLPKAVTFKLLETLMYHGYVARDSETGRFRLGIGLFELGSSALNQLGGREELHRALQLLVDKTNETAHLAILQGGDVLYLDKVDSPASLRMVTAVGRRRPAYCAGTGKALLAWQPPEAVRQLMRSEEVVRFTAKTITDPEALLRELAAVRTRGYALDDEENEPGIRCIGAPLRDDRDEVVAAISIAGPTVRITLDAVPELARFVIKAAEAIHESLGPALYGLHEVVTQTNPGGSRTDTGASRA